MNLTFVWLIVDTNVNFPTSDKVQHTAASLSFSRGSILDRGVPNIAWCLSSDRGHCIVTVSEIRGRVLRGVASGDIVTHSYWSEESNTAVQTQVKSIMYDKATNCN